MSLRNGSHINYTNAKCVPTSLLAALFNLPEIRRGDGLLIIRSGDGSWANICGEQRVNFREENLELKLFDQDGRLL